MRGTLVPLPVWDVGDQYADTLLPPALCPGVNEVSAGLCPLNILLALFGKGC